MGLSYLRWIQSKCLELIQLASDFELWVSLSWMDATMPPLSRDNISRVSFYSEIWYFCTGGGRTRADGMFPCTQAPLLLPLWSISWGHPPLPPLCAPQLESTLCLFQLLLLKITLAFDHRFLATSSCALWKWSLTFKSRALSGWSVKGLYPY